MHPRKTAQRLLRLRHTGMPVPEINLRDFVAIAGAGILQRERNPDRVLRRDFGFAQLRRTVGKPGVTQPVPEREIPAGR